MVYFLYFFSLVLMVHVTVSDLVGHYGNVVRWCNDNGLSCKDADPFTGKWVLTQEDQSQFDNARNDWNFTTPDSRYFNVDLSSGITVSHRNSNGHIIKENKFVWSCQCGATQEQQEEEEQEEEEQVLELCPFDINTTPLSDYVICGNLTGSLTMQSRGLFDLNPLRLEFIDGNVLLKENDALTSLTGLGALKSIGGYLEIRSNDALTNLAGLGALKSIGGYLKIRSNDALAALTGLDALTSIVGNLEIANNNALIEVTGFNALKTIVGSLKFFGNDALRDLASFNALTTVGESLDILENIALTNLTGFNALNSIGGDLDIDENNALLDVIAFESRVL